jgi:hypothetical protein
LAPTVGQGHLESIRADFSPPSTAAIAFICNTGGKFITAKARQSGARRNSPHSGGLYPLCLRRRRSDLIFNLPCLYIISASLASPPPRITPTLSWLALPPLRTTFIVAAGYSFAIAGIVAVPDCFALYRRWL